MKERYIKYIKWHLKSGSQKFSFLNPNDLQNLQDGFVFKINLFCYYIFILIFEMYNFSLKIPLHKR